MRFLCLHGTGSNNEIFELQTSTIRDELGEGYDFEFVEGTIERDVGPGMEMLGAVSKDGFYCYLNEEDATSIVTAVDQLDRYIASEGPFDGVMGFSQGAGLAAMLILRSSRKQVDQAMPVLAADSDDSQHQKQQQQQQSFKCAIFFSGEPPADPVAVDQGQVEWIKSDSSIYRGAISIPTVHVWGSNDDLYPEFGPILYELCQDDKKVKYIHSGGHEVPGHKVKDEAIRAVKAIRKMLDMVE